MGTDKRQRQKEGRQARIAAAEVAKRKADQRRRFITIGVSVLVTPWNFPLAVPARGIAPALAAASRTHKTPLRF